MSAEVARQSVVFTPLRWVGSVFYRLCKWFGVAVLLLFIVLAIGLPGEWLKVFTKALPTSMGTLSIGWVAYRPSQGLIVRDVAITSTQTGRMLASVASLTVDIELFSLAPLTHRVRTIELEKLYVAQLVYKERYDDPREIFQPHEPFPDLKGLCPDIAPIQIRATQVDVLNIKGNSLTATFEASHDELRFQRLFGELRPGDEVEGALSINLATTMVDLHLKGYALQTDINGVYRALNFPLIEKYSNKFKLNHNAWADARFHFSLDKFRNQFEGRIQLEALSGGSYCGVPFDSGKGCILTRGVWDNTTSIEDIQAFRKGELVAQGDLRFDSSKNQFSFYAKNEALSPKECLQLIDMPFTEVIPTIEVLKDEPSTLVIEGHLPFLTPQTPQDVVITRGHFESKMPTTIYGCQFATLAGDISMSDGVVTLDQLVATDDAGGSAKGMIQIEIPRTAEYVDLQAKIELDHLQLKIVDETVPLTETLGKDAVITGTASLSCRTDEHLTASLNADFDLRLQGKLLSRFPLFAGLTNIFADYVPGVSFLTDAKKMFVKGIIREGKLEIPEFHLEGSFFNVEGPVAYDFKTDMVDAALVVGIFRKSSMVGELTRWVLVPISEHLWQVHLTGTMKNPKWSSKTIVGKVKDVLLGRSDKYTTMQEDAKAKIKAEAPKTEPKEESTLKQIFFK